MKLDLRINAAALAVLELVVVPTLIDGIALVDQTLFHDGSDTPGILLRVGAPGRGRARTFHAVIAEVAPGKIRLTTWTDRRDQEPATSARYTHALEARGVRLAEANFTLGPAVAADHLNMVLAAHLYKSIAPV